MVQTLPFASTKVPSPGFGAMGISFGLGNDLTLEQAEPVLLKAIELGCTFWDTAVGLPCIYGSWFWADSVGHRSSTKPASTRSCWAISSANTMPGTRSSVSVEQSVTLPNMLTLANSCLQVRL